MATATKICNHCGKSYVLSNSPANIKKSKFCCKACFAESLKQTKSFTEFMVGRISERSSTKDNGCIEYTGPKAVYGHIEYKRKTYLAHRISWELHNGEIPKGMCICHVCDNPLCINPNHLFLGTYLDNVRDMITKGRAKHGQRKTPKVTPLIAHEIRALHKLGIPHKIIAEKFNISRPMVSMVANNKRVQDKAVLAFSHNSSLSK